MLKRWYGAICLLTVAVVPAAATPARSFADGGSAGLKAICGRVTHAHARCMSFISLDPSGRALNGRGHGAYGPADLQSAYNLPSNSAGSGQTVAIVDAFDDPNAESDLAVYRSTYGLPPCTTANGCFGKFDQNGGTNYPSPDVNWAAEISLDLDMVSAICPNCHILLIEANDNGFGNLVTAEGEAPLLGATEISNSWGSGEFNGETGYDGAFNHPGIPITVSSGDGAYSGGTQYPASSPYVTAVGGTVLKREKKGSRGWKETVWDHAGSGCSQYEAKPTWQSDSGCSTFRTTADVSAVASNVAAYDSYQLPGWLVFSGTSVSSPIVAGVYALAGNGASTLYGSYPYAHSTSLNDITKGSTGTCSPAYLCTGEPGYDGPSGLGTPNGTGGF